MKYMFGRAVLTIKSLRTEDAGTDLLLALRFEYVLICRHIVVFKYNYVLQDFMS